MSDPLTDAGQPVRIFPCKAGPHNVIQPDQSDTAVLTQIDRCVERGEISRREREHDDAEKAAVLGVDSPRHVDRDLMRDAPGHRLTDEDTPKPAIEMDAEVLAVAEVDRLRRGVERGREEPPVGTYDSRLNRRV